MAKKLTPDELENITSVTLEDYDSTAADFWEGTKNHDVTQNYEALLSELPKRKGLRILDFGCGPGRDLLAFKKMGHEPTGLDGTLNFCEMARKLSGCPVLHQNFLKLDLPSNSFDGIFANASLFHVPGQELVRVLSQLKAALLPNGILFSSNPRGNAEVWSGERYANLLEYDAYEVFLKSAGFTPIRHYYRPKDLPREQQPWLAVVSRAE